MTVQFQMLGNAALMERPKVVFLSSRRVAPAAVMRCYDWATGMRGGGRGETALPSGHAGRMTLPGGYLSLTVGKNGDVKATGKLADGTSVSTTSPLMYDEEMGWFAMLYAAPSAYKGGSFAAAVGLAAAVAGRPPYRLSPVIFAPQWTSRNPQATGEYGAGFVREVDLVGAYYNRLDTLRK